MKAGQVIQFNAQRILKGNPVKAIFLYESEEWIEVKLLKNIEGMVTHWPIGTTKEFRKSLIKGEIKVL